MSPMMCRKIGDSNMGDTTSYFFVPIVSTVLGIRHWSIIKHWVRLKVVIKYWAVSLNVVGNLALTDHRFVLSLAKGHRFGQELDGQSLSRLGTLFQLLGLEGWGGKAGVLDTLGSDLDRLGLTGLEWAELGADVDLLLADAHLS